MAKDFIYLRVPNCRPHENSDLLCVVELRQGTLVAGNDVKTGDQAFFMPAGSRPPRWLTDALGITQYLNDGRIGSVKLRGIKSQGALFAASRLKMLAGKHGWKFSATSTCPYEREIARHILERSIRPMKVKGKMAFMVMGDDGTD